VSALLSARGVSAGYGERKVVDGVSLEVRPGELWAVLGPNGAGKSTFLRALLGLHPLAQGSVELEGRKVAAFSPAERARFVAWVPQDFEPEGGFSGLELVLMGRAPHLSRWGLPAHGDVARARACLEELGIAHLAARSSTAMSGGERRLLLLARALVQEPRLLLLDEPTAFLDLKHQVDALARVRARLGPGFGAVAVLHDLNLAAAFADRVLLLREGRVLAQGPVAEVLEAKRLESLYQVPIAVGRSETGQPLFAPRPS
jgi:iron complex transport system ATP-binding protein